MNAKWMTCIVLLVWSTCLFTTNPASGQDAAEENVSQSDTDDAIKIYVGRSKVITAPWPVKRISVTDPKTADIEVVTPGQVVLLGKQIGSTDVIMWSEDNRMWHTRIDVAVDHSRLSADLKKLFPDARLQLTQSEEVLVVTGQLARAEQAVRLHKFLDAVAGMKYVDMTKVAGLQQVQIKVRVAEVSRAASRALGIEWFHTSKDFFGGASIGGGTVNIGVPAGTAAAPELPFTFNSAAGVGSAVTLLTGFPSADLEVFWQALADNQYLRILAEPNLIALNGEEASFLAGGEFPIPIVQGAGATTSGSSISVEYKEFGVRLRFRPVVLGDNTIHLEVASEVSDITFVNALAIQGFNIPTLLTRRATTTLELKSGQTFGMAGLIRRKTDAVKSQIPGLGSLPVLGPMFRSVRYETQETELVVMVTATLVEPMSLAKAPPLPGAMHVAPSDWELYAEGHIEGKVPAKISPADAKWFKDLGMDRLKGPGAWARHDQPMARNRPTVRPPSAMTVSAKDPAGPASNRDRPQMMAKQQ